MGGIRVGIWHGHPPHAFTRWMSLSLTAAGNADLAPLEILVLHNTNHRSRETPYAICFLLNIEDTHTVNYALSKLLKLGLLEADKRGQPAGDVGAVRSSQPCSSAAETGHVARKIAGTMSRRSSQFLKLRT